MADYDAMDEATLQRLAAEAESYEERSAIRQALRKKKKDRGENVGRTKARGNSVYNRFAGSTAPTKKKSPKNYVIGESEPTSPRPPSTGGRGSSRGSTTPTQQEVPASPVPRPRTPTPPPTPEQLQDKEEEPAQPEQEEEVVDEVDVEPEREEEAPLSPPPSPEPPTEPEPTPEAEEADGDERTPVAELPDQEQQDEEEVEPEPEVEREEERAPSPDKEEEMAVEEEPVSPREERASRRGREETDGGGARFGGVTLKSRRSDTTPSKKTSDEPKNEFLNLRLRQTSQDGSGGRGRKGDPETKVDFGIKLKSKPREKAPVPSPPTQKRATSSTSSDHGSPRTVKDYQELSSRSADRARAKRREQDEFQAPALEPDELQKYLVAYVNSELNLHPPLPLRGGALFDTCSNPTNLCKLVNKSVPNTVDLRALTKISSSASESAKSEALKENLTLALESARAIGCRVSDDSSDNILSRHPQTIRDFLVDLIRAKAVNLPGMDDEPSSTFTDMAKLFQKLNISVSAEEEVDAAEPKQDVTWRDDREMVRKALESPPPKKVEEESWRESPASKPPSDTTELSYEERAAMRRAQRERERKAKQAQESGSVELSYEDRAAQRRAERERRRREREALAK